MKIGLFGGTFNPIHRCHLTVATQVRERLHLDTVLFIPSGDPPHKPSGSLAPAAHRLEMVRLAIAGNDAFAISELEVRRGDKSYSIETVRALKAQYGRGTELYFLIGLDAFLELHTWKEAPSLLCLCHFVVISRPAHRFADLSGLPWLPFIDPLSLSALNTQGQDRLDIPLSEGTSLILLALPPCDASATDLRRRIRERRPLSNQLPASVESYIIRHRLYQEVSDRTGVQG